jgi:hypothetical protein
MEEKNFTTEEVIVLKTLKLNTNLNSVFHIYAVSNSYLYGH